MILIGACINAWNVFLTMSERLTSFHMFILGQNINVMIGDGCHGVRRLEECCSTCCLDWLWMPSDQ